MKILLYDIGEQPTRGQNLQPTHGFHPHLQYCQRLVHHLRRLEVAGDNAIYSTRCADIGDDYRCVAALRGAVDEADVMVHQTATNST